MGSDEDILEYSVALARDLGAEYAEGRGHRVWEQACILREGSPEPALVSDSKGIGLRVLYKGALSFGATNLVTRERVREMVEKCVSRAKASAPFVRERVTFAEVSSEKAAWRVQEKIKLQDVGVDEMLRLLRDLDGILEPGLEGVGFPHRLISLEVSLEEKEFVSSEGASLVSAVPRVGFHSFLGASYEGKIDTITIPPGYATHGQSGGWEAIGRLRLQDYVQEMAKRFAVVLKAHEAAPEGIMDIILGPSVTGLVAHESSGHPSEADRILGREAAQAGESYLKPDSIGIRIGSSEAYVSDDPTIPHSTGYYAYDDEGVPARKRRLIEGGIITEFLHNRATASRMDVQSNAASRAVDYDREPIVRMANTYIEPGEYSLEELISDIESGLLMESFMEWNIDDRRFNQRYVGLEAYLIENGRITKPVRNAVIEITTPKLWGSVDARARDLEFTAASCGKGDPMQAAPVWTGGPHIRLRKVRVNRR